MEQIKITKLMWIYTGQGGVNTASLKSATYILYSVPYLLLIARFCLWRILFAS